MSFIRNNAFVLALLVAGGVLSLGLLAGCEKQTTEAATPKFANVRCPIMTGNTIDPAKVPASLVREFRGEKVAFCCAGCPGAWDKLSDEEKAAKLAASK